MKEFISQINPETVIEAVKYIAMLALGALSLYWQSNARLREIAGKYIASAQVLYTDKEQRLNWVVAQIYKVVPAVMRPFLTPERVKQIVQAVFDGSKAYRAAWEKTLNDAVEAIPEPKPREGANARDY